MQKLVLLRPVLTIIYHTFFSIHNHNTFITAGKAIRQVVSIRVTLSSPAIYLQQILGTYKRPANIHMNLGYHLIPLSTFCSILTVINILIQFYELDQELEYSVGDQAQGNQRHTLAPVCSPAPISSSLPHIDSPHSGEGRENEGVVQTLMSLPKISPAEVILI